MGDLKRVRCAMRLMLAVSLMLCGFRCAGASVTASIVVNGVAQAGDASGITMAFNGFTETVKYDSSSTTNSVASAFAAMFSRDYLKVGLCAAAKGNVISLKLKSGVFLPLTITDSNVSFSVTPSGFPRGAPWTQIVTITNIGSQPATFNGFTLAGENATDFNVVSNSCSGNIAKGSYCTVTVSFSPSGVGTRSATLQFSGSGASSQTVIVLSGSS